MCFIHGCEDCSNYEQLIKSVENDVGKSSEGKSDEEEQK
jgi:hypothetical protein